MNAPRLLVVGRLRSLGRHLYTAPVRQCMGEIANEKLSFPAVCLCVCVCMCFGVFSGCSAGPIGLCIPVSKQRPFVPFVSRARTTFFYSRRVRCPRALPPSCATATAGSRCFRGCVLGIFAIHCVCIEGVQNRAEEGKETTSTKMLSRAAVPRANRAVSTGAVWTTLCESV